MAAAAQGTTSGFGLAEQSVNLLSFYKASINRGLLEPAVFFLRRNVGYLNNNQKKFFFFLIQEELSPTPVKPRCL